MKLCVQVSFNQGLVKTFLADPNCRLFVFTDTIKRIGRVRSWRFQPDVYDGAAVRLMLDSGNAVLVEDKAP